ncbi:hypothetical protein [Acetobacter ghanensis]|nr:hypothetical protein [Acetobacter ghanensis]
MAGPVLLWRVFSLAPYIGGRNAGVCSVPPVRIGMPAVAVGRL